MNTYQKRLKVNTSYVEENFDTSSGYDSLENASNAKKKDKIL